MAISMTTNGIQHNGNQYNGCGCDLEHKQHPASSVVMLSVIMLNVVKLSVIMVNVVKLSVIKLNVVMLNVV